MNGERPRPLRLHWLGMLLLGFLALLLPTFLPALAQQPPKSELQKPWTGRLADGRVITQADLDRILQEHALWLQSQGKEGQRADLRGARLFGANLNGDNLNKSDLRDAGLAMADLRGASLSHADMREANLYYADLRGASLSWANLSGANLGRANISKADLILANLTSAWLEDTDLSGARLFGANLSKTIFEPKPGTLPNVSLLANIQGLSYLRYIYSSKSLVELREAYKKAGMRESERQVTYALNHTRRIKLWEKAGLLNKVESLFNLIFFELPCRYGMNPGRALELLGLGLFLFTPLYLLALRSRDRETGIWLVRPSDRIIGGGSKGRPFKLTGHTPFHPLPNGCWARIKARLRRGLRRMRLAFYFSLLSAFNLGWRELNVGNLISRLQKNEYTLRATGWVRTVAGLQSLLSVYFLALWVLTYFGRPFD